MKRAAAFWVAFVLLLGLGPAATAHSAVPDAQASAGKRQMLRVVVMGLPGRGNALAAAGQIAYPGGSQYRKFLTQAQFRQQFGAGPKARQKVLSLRKKAGVRRVNLNASGTVALAVMTPPAARRLFCAGQKVPGKPCRPKGFKWAIRQVSLGEIFPQGPVPKPLRATSFTGTPKGCSGAIKSKALTPNQLRTAYGVDDLHERGLRGQGIAVNTLSDSVYQSSDFRTWAKCFGQPAPRVKMFGMPGAVKDTEGPMDETTLDVEALASVAPELQSITPIMVPLDQSFSNSFILFMLGSLDASRQGGRLPDLLSISDGVCEYQFTKAELQLGNRLLAEAAAVGVTALSASGDQGFQGCDSSRPGTNFPASSRFITGVGGTNLKLDPGNQILTEPVWNTFATAGSQGVGTGGGPSHFWPRPAFQTGPGVTPAIQKGKQTRLVPDVGAMASFKPGVAVYQSGTGGWGGGGGTSAATPITAGMVALAIQQEKEAGRPPLGSITPLLYYLARSPQYNSIFNDVKIGTGSRKPKSAFGKTPAGGAAQPGYDLATGLGSLRATAFADAVAALPSD